MTCPHPSRLLPRLAALACLVVPTLASAQTPEERQYAVQPAVEGLTFSGSLLSGQTGNATNTMGVGSLNFPLNSLVSGQVDLGVGIYDTDYKSTTLALHMYWRYWDRGALGLYADYANVNPEHAGRMGVEGAYHFDRVTVEGLIGMRNGTNVYTEWFDEIDVTYYFTDDMKASIGHRSTARGNVANVGFEFAPGALGGWTIFGEAETGEDDITSAHAGLRFTIGGAGYQSLIDRDRNGPMRVRAPRGLVDVSRCGKLPEKEEGVSFGGRHDRAILCASKDELDDRGAVEGKKTKEGGAK